MTTSQARHPDLGKTGAVPLISALSAAPTNSDTKLLPPPDSFVVTAPITSSVPRAGAVTDHKPVRPALRGGKQPAARRRANTQRELNSLHPIPSGSLPSSFALEPIYFPHAPFNVRAVLLQSIFLMLASFVFLSGALVLCLVDLHN